MLFLSVIFLVLHVLVILGAIIFSVVMVYAMATGVPPLSTNQVIHEEVNHALSLSSSSYVFDIGCGTGSMLQYLVSHNKGVKGYGCEINIPVALVAKYITRNLPIQISTKSFHTEEVKQELAKATHVYCYLFPEIMDELLPILQETCKKGTRVVSCDYKFSKLEETEHIILTKEKRLGKELFVYKL